MNIIDLTVPIHSTMAVWLGDPKVSNGLESSIKAGSDANVTKIQMSAHTGTHIDAPFHFVDNGISIDQMDLDLLIGEAEVIEIDHDVKIITASTLAQLGKNHWPLRVLFKTNNSFQKLLEKPEFSKEFVALEVDAAEFLIANGVKLVGIDYLSIAPFENGDQTHVVLLENEVIIIEGLNLTEGNPGVYQLIALPIKLQGADGAPARVVLLQS